MDRATGSGSREEPWHRAARTGPRREPDGATDIENAQTEAGARPADRETGALAIHAREAATRAREADREHALKLALLARASCAEGRTGARALEELAASARVSRQTLQEFVTLTTRWAPEEIATLLSTSDRCGRPVTRAVLLRLARGPTTRRAAFDEAVKRSDLDLAVLLEDGKQRRRYSGTVRTERRDSDFPEGEGRSQ